MNNEIKEILDYLKDIDKTSILKNNDAKILLDYITNLQQENERLKQPKIFIDTQDMEERYGEELYKDYLEKQVKDYKSRIEKVVEYIENNDFGITTFSDRDINGHLVIKIERGYVKKDELLNILNGKE